MILRLNAVAAEVAPSLYGHRVGVAIPLREPDPNGFPRPEESRQLDALEDQLAETLCRDARSVMVAVISTSGMREFVFYTKEARLSHDLLEALARDTRTHVVQHVVEPDPGWAVYRQLRGM